MIKETVTYKDYNGTERTEDFYFNFTEAELAEMQLEVDGGLEEKIRQILNANDTPKIVKIFKDTIFLKSYGKKSEDGRRMIKNQDVVDEFVQSPAYSILFMKYATKAEALAKFINEVIPADLKEKVAALQNQDKVVALPNVTGNNS